MPDPLDTTPYTSAAVQLYATALANARSNSNRDVLQEWWKLYDNAHQLAEVMAALDISDEGGRSYRVRNAEILSCEQQGDGGFELVWREETDGPDETRMARLGNMANPVFRLVKELADVCISQGLRANLQCGYEPNSRGWSTMVKGKKATPDYMRRVFRVQPLRSSNATPPAREEPANDRPPPPQAAERRLAAVPDVPEGTGPWAALVAALVALEVPDGTKIADIEGELKARINTAWSRTWNTEWDHTYKNAFVAAAKPLVSAGQLTKVNAPVLVRDFKTFNALAAQLAVTAGAA